MPCVEYPFYTFRNADGSMLEIPRIYLPVRFSNPDTGAVTEMEMALVDTGADSSVVPGYLAAELGHQLKNKIIAPNVTVGIKRFRAIA